MSPQAWRLPQPSAGGSSGAAQSVDQIRVSAADVASPRAWRPPGSSGDAGGQRALLPRQESGRWARASDQSLAPPTLVEIGRAAQGRSGWASNWPAAEFMIAL